MIYLAVCDDDVVFASELENALIYVCELHPIEYIIQVYRSGEQLIDDLRKTSQYDLIFLDIEMDNLNGVQVGEIIRDVMHDYETEIIYVSAYTDYHPAVLPLKPFAYLIKPVSQKNLSAVFRKFMGAYTLLHDRYVVRFKNTQQVIRKREIIYFESHRRNMAVTVKNSVTGQVSTIDYIAPMEQVKTDCQNSYFIQIHQSYFINMQFITELHPTYIILDNEYPVPIGRTYKSQVAVLCKAFLERNKQ